MFGLSFHVSASGVTLVIFMPSCASATPANAIKAPKKMVFFMRYLPGCLRFVKQLSVGLIGTGIPALLERSDNTCDHVCEEPVNIGKHFPFDGYWPLGPPFDDRRPSRSSRTNRASRCKR